MQSIKCRVPQGSVLGPLLILLYINDIAMCCTSDMIRIFADDTGIFIQGKDINGIIESAKETMKNVETWFSENRLTLNTEKTCFVIFKSNRWGYRHIPDKLEFGNKEINRVSSVKYLGLILDESLNWNSQVNEVCKNIKRYFPIFYNIRQYINIRDARTIYYTMIYSKIKYAIIVYGLTSNDNIEKLQILQNQLNKVLTKKNHRYRTNLLHNDLNILKINDIINQEIVSFVHGYINEKLPPVSENYFSHRFSIETYLNNERKIRFLTPTHRLCIGASTIKVKGPQLWNSLSFTFKQKVSSKIFRKKYRSSILPYSSSLLPNDENL